MKKISETVFVCNSCGNEFGKWAGQCPACHDWNSLKEVKTIGKALGKGRKRENRAEVKNLGKIGNEKIKIENIFLTGIKEFDRVLGKGIVRGQVILFAGEPGIGKSTLLTQLIGKIGGLYVAAEETAAQIAMRVERLGLDKNKFDILETNSIEEVEANIDRANNLFKIAVVDSIQMMAVENNQGVPGSVGQIRESTFRLVELAKKSGTAIFIVGHVTKEGEIAGPKILEHMVDTVLYFEGEKSGDLRMLRVSKNRFGSTEEIGVFKMEKEGLREIGAEEINLIDNKKNKIGSAVTVVMEGTRPMVVEIQALVTESFGNMPKRVFSGIDYNRGQLLVAVTQKVLGIPLYKDDVFVSVSGGVRLSDTGADLAVVGAIYSSYKNKAIEKGANKGIVLVGEVSLLGEIRKVRQWERREKEANRLGRKMDYIYSIAELKK